MYIKAKAIFNFGSLERLYVEMRPKKLPYNNMGNLAEIKFDGLVNSEILADFNLAERYSTVIRTLCMYARNLICHT